MSLIVDFPSAYQRQQRQLLHPSEPSQLTELYICPASFPRESNPHIRPAVVQFASHKQIIKVENLASQHKASLWFTSHEMSIFRQRQIEVVVEELRAQHISMATFAEQNIHDSSCFMGLENHLASHTKGFIFKKRKQLRDAIMREQARQHLLQIWDQDEMARVSEENSHWARNRARIIGLLHRDE